MGRKSPKNESSEIRDLAKRLAESLEREKAAGRALTEALDQQTTTGEILRVISSSPTDVQPVFDTIARNARRLCQADSGSVLTYDGERIHLQSLDSTSPASSAALRDTYPMAPTGGTAGGRAILTGDPVHIPDVWNDGDYDSPGVRAAGLRSLLAVPMKRDGKPVGCITVHTWATPRPFTDQQVELLKTFADQAVIALENVRLFTELDTRNRDLTTALDRQTATAEILRVISRSPTDAQPVFDAIVRNAVRLCDATYGDVYRFDGAMVHFVAHHNFHPEQLVRWQHRFPRAPGGGIGRVIETRGVVRVSDVHSDEGAVFGPAALELMLAHGTHSALLVPMSRNNEVVGVITLTHRRVGAFTEAHVELLQTFAHQAVIAIENVRLFTELLQRNADVTAALEQQTATSEVLRILSQSPTDVQPVFNSIVRSAQRLLSAYSCAAMLRVGDEVHLAAYTVTDDAGDAELTSIFPASMADLTERFPDVKRVWTDGDVLHTPDITLDAQGSEHSRLARARGFRARLHVPMRREGLVIGDLAVTRREPGPFAVTEIALLQTFADQAVIAIENVRLFTELQASNRELTKALDTQTATSDILRVISRSQTDVQPVFDAILESAVRLLGGYSGGLTRVRADQIELAALTSTDDAGDAALRARFPQSLHSEGEHAQALRDRAPLNIADAPTDPRLLEAGRASARIRGYRSQVVVPMLRHDGAVGTITVSRREPGGFTGDEIALLQTFADQAVIAIENVRLFTELQEKNEALTQAHAEVSEALEQQTATGEILRVIASSPTDVQPVLDAIARSVVRLCDGLFGAVFRFDGELLHFAAHYNFTPKGLEAFERVYPVRLTPEAPLGPAILERRIVHIPDTLANVRADYTRPLVAALGHRSLLAVPMLRGETPLGTINVARATPGSFTDTQIGLLKTFADQAVIAIENVRLFTELQASNRELTTALDTQTATSDILRVISRSQTDVQPVFDAILASAVRLLVAHTGALTRITGDRIELAAVTSTDPASDAALRATYPHSRQSEHPHAKAIRDRAPLNIADYQTDSRVPEASRAYARVRGYRSVVVVPMLRHDEAVGAISVSRREPGGFTDDEIALLETFADQAVIAIENARLLTELHARTAELTQSVGELRALGEVGQVISSTLDLQTVLSTIVTRATQLAGADAGVIYEYDAEREVFEPRATERLEPEIVEVLVTAPVRKGEGATGQLAISPEAVQLPDIHSDSLSSPHHARGAFARAGYRALLAVPLLREDNLIGGLTVVRKMPGEFPRETIELLQTFATQSALAVQNARLFREIEDKSRQLEAASRHKSEFLANMSHELRTPLNAIIGFSEVLTERMFGELNEKQDEYLKDIHASGQHLLSLINDILDLSKIEAGRMELEPEDFDLPGAIDNALTLVRERAGRRGIGLGRAIDERVGTIRADERKVKQVLLNLLSNALKFTPEGGRIDVSAAVHDELVEVSVADTGVGIAPEDQEAVFEEFRQVGTADKKVEGTGLGLALSRKFIELHGGRIWVKSQVGTGSTFTFTIPVRREPSDRGVSATRSA